MAISVTGVLRAINKLSEPLQKRIMKRLGLSMDDLPGRTSKGAGINVGKERFNRKEVRDQIKGSVKTLGYGGAAYAGYSAGDFISDLLGIKKVSKDSTFTKEELAKLKQKKESSKPKGVDLLVKTERKLTEKNMPKPKPKDLVKKKKVYMKEGKTGKDSKVEFKATTGNTGLLASKKNLKPIPTGNKGKGLSMLGKSVRNNMGFMYGGGMPMPSKKPRMSTTDYRKASKGMLIISVDMKKKPKIKKNKRG